jgi:hypothetical protein
MVLRRTSATAGGERGRHALIMARVMIVVGAMIMTVAAIMVGAMVLVETMIVQDGRRRGN